MSLVTAVHAGKRTAIPMIVSLVFIVLAATMSTPAKAEGWYENYCSTTHLAGSSYCVGAVEGPLFSLFGEDLSGYSICVGPVTYSGGKFSFPYGWSCGEHQVDWEFTTINAHPGLDNPNSKAIEAGGLAFYH